MADDRKDPLTSFLFGLKIADLGLDHKDGTAFFKSVSGLSVETEVQDFPEGGITTFQRKIVTMRKFKPIVLKQGFTGDRKLWDWRMKPRRVDGTIYQLGVDMKPICRWEFKRGYPSKYDGPELDASKSDLAIESIEIAHEGIEMYLEEEQEEA